jgi:hydroxyethylthiazole kinase-like uncharacterized protein yjeF
MRDWEKATWQSGTVTEQEVIARVGAIIARESLRRTAAGDRILLLAGKGHNGDDVRAARTHLEDRQVELLEVADPSRQLPELAEALARHPALIVDGLFGIGLNRPLDEDWKVLIDRINRSRAPVLAVDVPSGLNCETGQSEGAVIKARATLTLGAVKRGLIAPAAVPYVGDLELAEDIGLIRCTVDTGLQWTHASDFAGFPPALRRDAHKGDFGHLVIIAGSLGFHGAAVLAARGAQAARPGLITVVTTDETYLPVAGQLQSVMVRPWRSDWEVPGKTTAILFGPGLADPTVPTGLRKQAVQLWQEFEGSVVGDASGLNWLAEVGCLASSPRVVTPHPGEAARLLKVSTTAVQADRLGSLQRLSDQLGGVTVVLKGHQTLVGAAEGNVFVNATGGPLLGQGGSGDVLAGFLGGLLAQAALLNDPLHAIRYGVWRHGSAGDSPEWSGLIDDLPRMLVGPFVNERGAGGDRQ